MSEVTARKWRPQNFSDFVGQEYITNTLKMSLTADKVGHGYIFSGCRGVGKTSAARVFAKALNCLNRSESAEPCEKCQSCEDIRLGRSVDVVEIDGASNRGIDKMRDIKENIQFLPSYSRYKIYIIDEVHMLTTEAFNAILKILEEPPLHIIFMFATTEIHKVKTTIRSRCQQYFFKRLTVLQIANHLEHILKNYKVNYEYEALQLIAKSADGSMRDSQSLLDQAIVYSENNITKASVTEILSIVSYEYLYAFFDCLVQNDVKKLEKWLNTIYMEGLDLSFFIVQIVEQLRIIILMQHGACDHLDLEKEHFTQLQTYLGHFSVYQCHEIINKLLELHKGIKDTDQEFFLFQNTLFQLLDYRSFVSVHSLVKKLEQLENNILNTNPELSVSYGKNTEDDQKPSLGQNPQNRANNTSESFSKSVTQEEPPLQEKTSEKGGANNPENPSQNLTLNPSPSPTNPSQNSNPSPSQNLSQEEPSATSPKKEEEKIMEQFQYFINNLDSTKLKVLFQDIKKILYLQDENIASIEFYKNDSKNDFSQDAEAKNKIIQFFEKQNKKVITVNAYTKEAVLQKRTLENDIVDLFQAKKIN